MKLSLSDFCLWVAVGFQVYAAEPLITNFTNPPSFSANMVLIPAGNFTMGDVMDDIDTLGTPTHTVYVSAFYMDKYEVSKQLWDDVYNWATNHGYSFKNGGGGKATNHPVHTVNWYDCVKWCNARSEKEGRIPAYYTTSSQTTVYRIGQAEVDNADVKWNAGYRLPTEAEWEKAARGGLSGKRFPWGDTITHQQANYYSSTSYGYDISQTRGNHPSYGRGTSPVGAFYPNGYELYDMAGNVWEWCWDWLGSYNSGAQSDPRGPTSGSFRVLRGGSWGSDCALDCGAAFRYIDYPDSSDSDIGFRTVLPSVQ